MFSSLKNKFQWTQKIFWPLIKKILIWTFWDYKSSWSKKSTPIQPLGVKQAPPYFVFWKDAILGSVPSISSEVLALHSDAFFRSQRDINRHGSWLDFWKIQVNLVNFISGTFGTAWDKYSKNGLTFGCLREKKGWNFDLEIIFFKQKQDFGIFI